MQPDDEAWTRYARAVIRSMNEVLEAAAEEHRPLLLETADYWLAVGVSLGLRRPEDAARLLELLEVEPGAREELERDAEAFAHEVLP